MSDEPPLVSLTDVLALGQAFVDALQQVELTSTSQDDLVSGLVELERIRQRLEFADYRVINELDSRGVPGDAGCPSVGQYLRGVLKLHPIDAATRAAAAEAAGPRRDMTSGQELPVPFVHVAAVQAAGDISQRSARLIEKTIDGLADEVQAEHGEQIEKELVEHATHFDPSQLARIAQRISYCYDQDGVLAEDKTRERRYGVTVSERADGSARFEIEASPELAQRLLPALDGLAAPLPAEDGTPDQRSGARRLHDALLALVDLAVRSGELSSVNGIAGTFLVTMTTEQYLNGEGLAVTGRGALVPAAEALRWGGGDVEIMAVAINSMRAVTHYGDTRRIYTRKQRLAITARDRGCTFPGCPLPASRCQINHVQRHEHDGPTSVSNGALVCPFHHRLLDQQRWAQTMIDGVPHWLPPTEIDPHRTPRRTHCMTCWPRHRDRGRPSVGSRPWRAGSASWAAPSTRSTTVTWWRPARWRRCTTSTRSSSCPPASRGRSPTGGSARPSTAT